MAMVIRSTLGADGGVRTVLRFEGLALLSAAVAFFTQLHASWTLFALLFLAPDMSLAFYLAGARAGATAYNAAHSTVGPILCALASRAALPGASMLLPVALIWFAHVGFDRALGYGLKYASGFSDTHLGFIGKKRNQPA